MFPTIRQPAKALRVVPAKLALEKADLDIASGADQAFGRFRRRCRRRCHERASADVVNLDADGDSEVAGITVLVKSRGSIKSSSTSKSAGWCCLLSFSPHSVVVFELRMLSALLKSVPMPIFSTKLLAGGRSIVALGWSIDHVMKIRVLLGAADDA